MIAAGGLTVEWPTLRADDGAALPATLWRPLGAARAIAVGLHSFGDHRGAYSALGPWLARAGVACLAYDQRGFGETRPFGRLARPDRYVEDLAGALSWLARSAPCAPRLVIGESLGGALAVLAAARKPHLIDGLVLAAPAVRRNQPHRLKITALIATAGRVAPQASFLVARRCPSAAEAPAARLAADPRVLRRIRAGALLAAMRACDAASSAARAARAPTLILSGGRDWLVAPASIAALAADLQGPVEHRRYPTAPHLLLQCRDRLGLFADIGDWLEDWLATRPTEPPRGRPHWRFNPEREHSS